MGKGLRVLMITSEWPTPEHPEWAPFIVQQVRFLRRAGVDVDVFPFRGAKRPWNYAKARIAVWRKLKHGDYDLVHAQFGQSGLLVIPPSLPFVVTFRGSDVMGIVGKGGRYTFMGKVLRQVSRLVALWTDEAIVVSKQLIRYLPKRKRYHVIPSGLDLELFRPMDQGEARGVLGLPQDIPIVLFGANPVVPRKRFALAQKALTHLKRRIPDVEMIALNGVPRERVPIYMNASDVMLLCSLHEGSPNTVKEALACNLPVVSTDVGDVRERIGAVEGCIVCEDDRPETIANALYQVLIHRRRVKGREAIRTLDERLVTRRVIEIYHRAIEKRNRVIR